MMNYKSLTACLVLLLAVTAFAEKSNRGYRPTTALDRDFTTYIDANKILMFVTNKGSFAFDNGVLLGKADGLYYPYTGIENIEDGSNTTSVIYAASIWMGAVIAATDDPASSVGDTLVTSGQHDTDWGEGPLVFDAGVGWSVPVPGAITDSRYRVYKLYGDSLADNPNTDYLEWPVADGAPVDSTGAPLFPAGVPSQVCWSVYNDLDLTAHVGAAGTADGRGLGIEVRQMMWAYDVQGALANMVFARFRIFNKGPHDLENMYVSLWADPDLGSASDDYVGCDTVLSLGYCYNAGPTDTDYGSRPPAVGYDFFQGPLIATGNNADTAIMWDFQKFAGFTNMGMTSYNKYVNPYGPDDATDSYEFMTGLQKDGTPLVFNGDTTKYFGWGDPVTGTGYLDADPADRRWMQSTGPFTLNRGDSTEIVAAIIVAQGTDYLNSITQLKAIDGFAQKAYDQEFQLPQAPAPPDVTASELDGEIVLSWGTASEDDPGDYPFEGYAVFQGEVVAGGITVWDTLAWFDLNNGIRGISDFLFDPSLDEYATEVTIKPGLDNGLAHNYRVRQDAVGGGLLVNYQSYMFKVEAYSYDPAAPALEKTKTSATQVTVSPHPPIVGTEFNSEAGDTLAWQHPAGGGDGTVHVEVLHPESLTGDAYQVVFEDVGGSTVWHLINTSTNDTVLADQTNQSGDGAYVVVDGLQVKVMGPPLEGKDWAYASASPLNVSPVATADNGYAGGNRWFSGDPTNGGELLFGSIFMEPNFWGLTSVAAADMKTVEIRYRPMVSYTDLTGDGEFTPGEPYVVDDPGQTQSAFMYTTFSGSAYEGFYPVPFTAWDVSDPGNPRQLNIVHRDRDGDMQWQVHYDARAEVFADSLPNGGDLRFPYLWILNTDYDASGTMYGDGTGGTIDFWDYQGGDGVWDAMWVAWQYERGTSRGMLAEECTLTLTPNIVNSAADQFTFTTAGFEPSVATTGDAAMLQAIKAVPNPYYLFSSYDAGVVNRVMKFINLPAECTITIYNLGGDQVRQLTKDDNSAELEWDVLNHASIPVASGIYIYVVEAPDFGQKIGKMAIFTETEQLNQF